MAVLELRNGLTCGRQKNSLSHSRSQFALLGSHGIHVNRCGVQITVPKPFLDQPGISCLGRGNQLKVMPQTFRRSGRPPRPEWRVQGFTFSSPPLPDTVHQVKIIRQALRHGNRPGEPFSRAASAWERRWSSPKGQCLRG